MIHFHPLLVLLFLTGGAVCFCNIPHSQAVEDVSWGHYQEV